MPVPSPFNFNAWLDEHKHLLKPPVMAKTIWADADIMVTVVGGPNKRTDFHVDPYEEIFYQVKGDITVFIQEDGKVRPVHIKEGETWFLPANVPHAPTRPADTIGVIVEWRRRRGEIDAHEWYCQQCNSLLFRKEAKIELLERDMPPVFEAYYSNPDNQVCKNCGHVNPGRPN